MSLYQYHPVVQVGGAVLLKLLEVLGDPSDSPRIERLTRPGECFVTAATVWVRRQNQTPQRSTVCESNSGQ
jgi:hypothetical protein